MGMIGNSLAQGLISGANIQDGTVDTPDIKDGAIHTAKVADDAVHTAKIADDAVHTAKIADGAVTSDKLADSMSVSVGHGSTAWTGITGSALGYSNQGYKITKVGASTGTNNIALGVDVSGNTSGAFTGYRDIFVSNDAGLYQPNSANDDYHHLMGWDDNETVFNDSGRARDFRVESDSNQHMLFVDGGANKVTINSNTGDYALNVFSNLNSSTTGTVYVNTALNGSGTGVHVDSTSRTSAEGNTPMLLLTDRGGSTALNVQVDGETFFGNKMYADPAGAYTGITSLGWTAPIQVQETDTGTTSYRYMPMISQTSVSTSGYRQHTVFGSARGSAWGEAFIAVGGHDGYPTNGFFFNYQGTFTAPGTKNFRIPHPVAELSETHDLVHAAVEGPQADLLYRGVVALSGGVATVDLDEAARMTPGTFELLCKNAQCFTTNEADWDAVRGSVSGATLTIECQNSGSSALVGWMVIAERNDDVTQNWPNGRLEVEPQKNPEALPQEVSPAPGYETEPEA